MHPWKAHLLFGTLLSPSVEKGWAAHDSCHGCHNTQVTRLFHWLLTFLFTLVFGLLFCLAEKQIGGQRHSVLLCVEAWVKLSVCLWFCFNWANPTIFNVVVCCMKSCIRYALVLSSDIWKSTKYVIFMDFSYLAKSSIPTSAVLELGISLLTEQTSFSFTFWPMFLPRSLTVFNSKKIIERKRCVLRAWNTPCLSRTALQKWVSGAETLFHSGCAHSVTASHLITSHQSSLDAILTSSHCEFVLIKGLIHQGT